MNFLLFDDQAWEGLLPLTYTRPVCECRVGILTIREKWERFLGTRCSYLTQSYLSHKFKADWSDDQLLVNGSILPDHALVPSIMKLKAGQSLKQGELLIAARLSEPVKSYTDIRLDDVVAYSGEIIRIARAWHIFQMNGKAMEADFDLITEGRTSMPVSATNRMIGHGRFFAEEDAWIECATINTTAGSVYVGHGAEVSEGAMIRGAFALCDHSTLKMGAKVYGPTTIGPHCKVGGEVSNSVIFGYSNKAHDGFLGNSVMGQWCNLGADTNNSNLKNNYSDIKVWSCSERAMTDTGLQFCGLIMGDHSKSGINTMFNTGTVVGVSANIFGAGFPDKFVPSFAWGSQKYRLEDALITAARVMERRGIHLDTEDVAILRHVFDNE